VVSALLLARSSFVSASSSAREVGLLRSVGFTTRACGGFIVEGLLIAIAGGAIGAAARSDTDG
jgi:ABC-type lipoprotein release transport system permease subunit